MRRYVMNSILRRCSQRACFQHSKMIHDVLNRQIFGQTFPHNLELAELLSGKKAVYCGFDPTADSLHLGNLLPFVGLLQLGRLGHDIFAVIGGATSLIGDPSFRTNQRNLMKEEELNSNCGDVQTIIDRIISNCNEYFDLNVNCNVINNTEFYSDMSPGIFLSRFGRHLRVGALMQRDAISHRFTDDGGGLNLAELCYPLFQAYDFLHLHRTHNCTLQIGGSDQMGNIVAGHDLIKSVTGTDVCGLTIPLMLAADGTKFGKSEGNAIWLDPAKTSPFELYQYLTRRPDSEVAALLKRLTFSSLPDIETWTDSTAATWKGQTQLARNVMLLVHGDTALKSAEICSEILYGSKDSTLLLQSLGRDELQQTLRGVKFVEVMKSLTFLETVKLCKDYSSHLKCINSIERGGVSVNGVKITNPYCDQPLPLSNGFSLYKFSKRDYVVVKIV